MTILKHPEAQALLGDAELTADAVRAAFGQPARIYYAGRCTVLVWERNIRGFAAFNGSST